MIVFYHIMANRFTYMYFELVFSIIFTCRKKRSANAGDKIIIRKNYTINDGYSGSTSAWHSLIASSHGDGVTSILTESKLGEFGVYRAPLYDMMVLYKGDYYNIYQGN